MDIAGYSVLNFSSEGNRAFQYTLYEAPVYKEYKPISRDLIQLPKSLIYLILAAIVVVAVAYAIVGHLIKDLVHDVLDCTLGPQDEDLKVTRETDSLSLMPVALTLSHPNAFHVWDQDDVVIPLQERPQGSPLLAVIPYIPHFFPSSCHNSSSPPHIHPSQGHPHHIHPPQGHPHHIHPPQGHPHHIHPPQGHPHHIHPPQGHPAYIHLHQGHHPQGHPPEVHPPQGQLSHSHMHDTESPIASPKSITQEVFYYPDGHLPTA